MEDAEYVYRSELAIFGEMDDIPALFWELRRSVLGLSHSLSVYKRHYIYPSCLLYSNFL